MKFLKLLNKYEEGRDVTKIFNSLKGTTVYVTIGLTFSKIPLMQKVMLYVDHETDTPATMAKKLRQQVADNIENHGFVKGTNFTPAELYFEIYGDVNNTIPFFCSTNAPHASKDRV